MNKKLGYYSIGLQNFASKIDACILGTKVIDKLNVNVNPFNIVKWNFNDDVFDNYQWSVEPEKSLDELYDERAKNLREQYDYIIISYSGGADSHNMLMSFLRQGLFVDEIVVTHMNKAMKDYAIIDPNNLSAEYAYATEYALQTLPRLEEIRIQSPQTKIRVFDVSDSVFNAFSKRMDESWVFHVREELNPIDASRYNYLQYSEFKTQLDFNKKIAILLGVDKPGIIIDESNNKIILRFADRLANITPIGEYAKDYTNTTIEYFYWSPDACDLLCKQAHIIAKWLKQNPGFQKYFIKPSAGGRATSDRILRPLLYTTWNSTWFQAEKAIFDWYSNFDSWFIQGHFNSLEYLLWRKGLNYVTKNCKYFITPGKTPDGLARFYKEYEFTNLK